jgi:hypothetical protein
MTLAEKDQFVKHVLLTYVRKKYPEVMDLYDILFEKIVPPILTTLGESSSEVDGQKQG